MPPLLLIDGYNLSQPIAPIGGGDPRWLQRHRQRLLSELARHLPAEVCRRTCVVFDAADPPPDRSDRLTVRGIEVRFAVQYPSADDLLEEIIRQHHTPKRLLVVSSDHRIQTAASRRGARFTDSEPWMDDLTDGRIHLAVALEDLTGDSGDGDSDRGAGQGGSGKPRVTDPEEVEQWLREFGFDDP